MNHCENMHCRYAEPKKSKVKIEQHVGNANKTYGRTESRWKEGGVEFRPFAWNWEKWKDLNTSKHGVVGIQSHPAAISFSLPVAHSAMDTFTRSYFPLHLFYSWSGDDRLTAILRVWKQPTGHLLCVCACVRVLSVDGGIWIDYHCRYQDQIQSFWRLEKQHSSLPLCLWILAALAMTMQPPHPRRHTHGLHVSNTHAVVRESIQMFSVHL